MAALSPAAYAYKLDKWAEQGLNYALVVGAKAALERDVVESRARIHSRTGRLAETVRLTEPSATRTRRKGFFRISLTAGSKAKGNPVKYASVLQLGRVGGPNGFPRSRPHIIEAKVGERLSFMVGGQKTARASVLHPGTRYVAQEYLKVNEPRAVQGIDAAINRSAKVEL